MRGAGLRRRGFTLAEIVVALAIMVILFALLFAPMMVGLDWVASGRAHVGLQDSARLAMEQIRRELGEAVHIPRAGSLVNGWDGVSFPGSDGVYGTSDDEFVPNHSQIFFCPPARDAQGRVLSPPRPMVETYDFNSDGVVDARGTLLVRYVVRRPDPAEEHSEYNPFVLYRQEFLWDESQPGRVGRYDTTGVWEPYRAMTQSALTPQRGGTFIPTTTVSWTAGALGPDIRSGYRPEDGDYRMYLFQGLQFVPERIVGEQVTTGNGTTYRSRYGGWDGTPPEYFGVQYLSANRLRRSEIDPRIVMLRWSGVDNAFTETRSGMDSRYDATRSVRVQWSPEDGVLTVGRWASRGTGEPYRAISFDAPTAPGGWYGVVPDAGIQVVWPALTATPQDEADAPVAYHVDPTAGGGPALVDPASVSVRVVGYVNGVRREVELKPTNNPNQSEIQGDEFFPMLYRRDFSGGGFVDGTGLTLRFSRYDPPRPTSLALFGNGPAVANGFQIRVSYLYRRNFTYVAGRDVAGRNPFVNDTMRLDYSTRTIQNVTLALQRYTELWDDGTGALRVPPDERPITVTVQDQIRVRNYAR